VLRDCFIMREKREIFPPQNIPRLRYVACRVLPNHYSVISLTRPVTRILSYHVPPIEQKFFLPWKIGTFLSGTGGCLVNFSVSSFRHPKFWNLNLFTPFQKKFTANGQEFSGSRWSCWSLHENIITCTHMHWMLNKSPCYILHKDLTQGFSEIKVHNF